MVASKSVGLVIGIIIVVLIIAVAYNSLGAPSGTASANTSSVHTTILQNKTATYNATSPKNLSVLYVSVSGSDTNPGNISAPLNTINHAVKLAKPGDVIFVEPGTYNEQINITSPVVLEGENPNTTIINASGQTNGINVIGPGANGTIINGLTVKNADNHGIYVQDVSNVWIMNNLVEHNGVNATVCPTPPAKPTGPCINEDKPIELVGTSNVTVENNIVTGNLADGGIGVADLGFINPGSIASTHVFANAIHNRIIGNRVTYNKNGCGIVVASYNKGVIDNIVEDNFVGFGVAGIVIAADTPNSTALNNEVINNTATKNFIPGIILHSNAPGDVLSNTTVEFNRVSGNGADAQVGALNKTGIVVSGDVMPVQNTTIKSNNVSDEYYGIWMRNAPNANLLNNTVANVTVANYTK